MTQPDTSIKGDPSVYRYTVGDCEMLPRHDGQWIEVGNFVTLIDYLLDDDDRDVMLEKLKQLRAECL